MSNNEISKKISNNLSPPCSSIQQFLMRPTYLNVSSSDNNLIIITLAYPTLKQAFESFCMLIGLIVGAIYGFLNGIVGG